MLIMMKMVLTILMMIMIIIMIIRLATITTRGEPRIVATQLQCIMF